MPRDTKLTVYYDGSCPLCAREIAFYKKRSGADTVCWQDVSAAADGHVAPGLTKDAALKRFHIRDQNGAIHAGGAAFARLWSALPAFRWLGWIGRIAPISTLLEVAYWAFLIIRPRLQALAAKKSV